MDENQKLTERPELVEKERGGELDFQLPQKLTRPIKTPVIRDEAGRVIVPEGYRFVAEINRVRNGKEETIREHCRLIRPVKQRMSLKRRAALLMEQAGVGGAGPVVSTEQGAEFNLTKFRIISNIRREINRALDEMEIGQ